MKHGWRFIVWTSVLVCVASARAQEIPPGSVRMIVPFAPGASSDALGRLVALKVQENAGLLMHVENQAGGSGLIGMGTVVRAAPNGLTVGLASPSTHTIAAATRKNMPYHAINDFTFISTIAKHTSAEIIQVIYTVEEACSDNLEHKRHSYQIPSRQTR